MFWDGTGSKTLKWVNIICPTMDNWSLWVYNTIGCRETKNSINTLMVQLFACSQGVSKKLFGICLRPPEKKRKSGGRKELWVVSWWGWFKHLSFCAQKIRKKMAPFFSLFHNLCFFRMKSTNQFRDVVTWCVEGSRSNMSQCDKIRRKFNQVSRIVMITLTGVYLDWW